MTDSSNSSKSNISSVADLCDFVWYWGDVTKDVVAAALENQKDGTFVVRDASTPGDFTLTLRVNATNKLIKILVRNGRCGFTADSLDFSSIVELVSFYRRRSLKDFNDQLDISLLYPLVNPKEAAKRAKNASRLQTLGEEVVKCRLEGLQAEYERVSRHYDKLVEQHAAFLEAAREKRSTLEAYAGARALFLRNINMLQRSIDNQTDNHRANFYNNIELQKERVADLAKAQTLMSNALHNIEKTIVRADEEISATQPRLADVRRQRDACRDVLAQRNASQIERFLKEVNYILDMESPKLSTFFLMQMPGGWAWEPQWWLVANPDKDYSTHVMNVALSNSPSDQPIDGVFFIRPSLSRVGCFVLVITMHDEAHNCLIEYRDSTRDEHTGYGFLNTDMFFTTLVDFVRYYAQINLREHNAQLDTILRRPALLY